MTDEERVMFLLEWANKTHNTIEEMIYVINDLTAFIYEREGEFFPKLKLPKKIIN